MAHNTIYRTEDPKIIEQYQANLAQIDAQKDGLIQLLDEFGLRGRELWGSRMYDGRKVIRGVLYDKDETVPAGWYMPKSNGYPVYPVHIEPDRRRKAGKDIDRRLMKLSSASPKFDLGMPLTCFDDHIHQMHWFGVALVDNTLWVTWGVDTDVDKTFVEDLNPAWERVKLSDYYALVEADQDPFKAA